MKNFAALLLVICLLSGCRVYFSAGIDAPAARQFGTSNASTNIAVTANKFLERLDSGATEKAWKQGSPYLHRLTSDSTVWTLGIRGVRGSVGTFQSRRLLFVGFTHKVEDLPTGDYAAAIFETKFRRYTMEERVVLHNDNGSWKVMGYIISKSLRARL